MVGELSCYPAVRDGCMKLLQLLNCTLQHNKQAYKQKLMLVTGTLMQLFEASHEPIVFTTA